MNELENIGSLITIRNKSGYPVVIPALCLQLLEDPALKACSFTALNRAEDKRAEQQRFYHNVCEIAASN